jgi:hypothetical protein
MKIIATNPAVTMHSTRSMPLLAMRVLPIPLQGFKLGRAQFAIGAFCRGGPGELIS